MAASAPPRPPCNLPRRPVQILAIINHPSALPYLIGERIAARGASCYNVNPHAGGVLPRNPDGHAGLLVLGGSMSVADPDYDHVFEPVTALIRAFHAADKPVLGVCLGSQLLARSFAGAVYPLGDLEVGYVPLELTDAGAKDALLTGLARRQTIFEWHEDTFDLPAQAELLMTGATCRHQAFRVGATSYGFQCHFEVGASEIETWIGAGRDNLEQHRGARADAVEYQIRSEMSDYAPAAARFARTLADGWMDLVVARAERGAA